jgi:hypothetical protein
MTPTNSKMFQANDKSTVPKTNGFLLRFCLMLNYYICRIGSQGFVHDFAHLPIFLPIENDKNIQGLA